MTDTQSAESLSLSALFAKKKLALQATVGAIKKDKTNAYHKYRYASAEAVLSAVSPAMIEAKMATRPRFTIVSGGENGHVTVECELVGIDAETGYEELLSTSFGSGQDTGDKAIMKAQTAALKYAWMTALNIPTGDDPEADAKTDQSVSEGIKQPQRKPAPMAALAEASEAEDGSEANKLVAEIKSVKPTSGTRDGKQWTRYDILTKTGDRLSTFSDTLANVASMAAANGDQLELIWSPDPSGRFKNLIGIEE